MITRNLEIPRKPGFKQLHEIKNTFQVQIIRNEVKILILMVAELCAGNEMLTPAHPSADVGLFNTRVFRWKNWFIILMIIIAILKHNKASQAIQSPRTVPFFLLVSLLDGYSYPNVLVKGIIAFKH